MAAALSERHETTSLDLDTIAWAQPGVRHALNDTLAALDAFTRAHQNWIIEGCYSSLIERALQQCTEFIFLDPGVDACLANNRIRPWEPQKYPSSEAQDEKLPVLQSWVREYYNRDDEYSHRRHLEVFEGFAGPKRRVTGTSEKS